MASSSILAQALPGVYNIAVSRIRFEEGAKVGVDVKGGFARKVMPTGGYIYKDKKGNDMIVFDGSMRGSKTTKLESEKARPQGKEANLS